MYLLIKLLRSFHGMAAERHFKKGADHRRLMWHVACASDLSDEDHATLTDDRWVGTIEWMKDVTRVYQKHKCEWSHLGFELETCNGTCTCGQEDLHYEYTIYNSVNSNQLTVGSTCVKQYMGHLMDQLSVASGKRNSFLRAVKSERQAADGESFPYTKKVLEVAALQGWLSDHEVQRYTADRRDFTQTDAPPEWQLKNMERVHRIMSHVVCNKLFFTSTDTLAGAHRLSGKPVVDENATNTPLGACESPSGEWFWWGVRILAPPPVEAVLTDDKPKSLGFWFDLNMSKMWLHPQELVSKAFKNGWLTSSEASLYEGLRRDVSTWTPSDVWVLTQPQAERRTKVHAFFSEVGSRIDDPIDKYIQIHRLSARPAGRLPPEIVNEYSTWYWRGVNLIAPATIREVWTGEVASWGNDKWRLLVEKRESFLKRKRM